MFWMVSSMAAIPLSWMTSNKMICVVVMYPIEMFVLVVVGSYRGMNGRENGQHQLSNPYINTHTHTSRETTYCTLGTNEMRNKGSYRILSYLQSDIIIRQTWHRVHLVVGVVLVL
jgi:hypothetical protein